MINNKIFVFCIIDFINFHVEYFNIFNWLITSTELPNKRVIVIMNLCPILFPSIDMIPNFQYCTIYIYSILLKLH